jgi:succinyl-diaminopimelate desuccinylase
MSRRSEDAWSAPVRVPTVTHDARSGERLASRTLQLIDIASESRAETALARHIATVLTDGGVPLRDLGDDCLLAGAPDAPVLLAGHLDTVPAQDNRPGRRDDRRVHGLGASDMKGALAVMVELALAGAPFRCLFFGREELPVAESALAPLLERERAALDCGLVLMMEPTDNEVHAGCLGNVNARWVFHGRSGHSARPWTADNAIERAAAGVSALAAHDPEPCDFDGLRFVEVASVTTIRGGIALNVIPDRVECGLNFRYAPGRAPQAAERRLRELTAGHGELLIDSNAPSAPVAVANPLTRSLVAHGGIAVAPKQAWTPVAEFAAAGLDAVNFGPGAPAQAHRQDESIEVDALVRCFTILESWRP